MSDISHFNPSFEIIQRETQHILLSYCSFVTLIKGKRMSLQNIFLATLQENKLRTILKEMLSIDSDIEIVKLLIEHDPTILKSKYVTRYINTVKGSVLK